ncbi:MAG: peptide deformylase [Tissierellia bacterium]|nr:peptide deformylase [Tissierellia bacterium]
MALRKVRVDGDPILRKISKEVTKIDSKLEVLIQDMIETMRYENGIGLASPQVGILKRLIVIDIGEEPIIAINPVIENEEGKIEDIEGCLSVPNLRGKVDRPENIKVKFMNQSGEEVIMNAEGYVARVFCHEIDHLNGILYTDLANEVFDYDPEDDEE